jgi:hypothetical protein
MDSRLPRNKEEGHEHDRLDHFDCGFVLRVRRLWDLEAAQGLNARGLIGS